MDKHMYKIASSRAPVGSKNRRRVLLITTVSCENSLSSILLITLRHHLLLSERLFLALWYNPHHKVQFYLKATYKHVQESLSRIEIEMEVKKYF